MLGLSYALGTPTYNATWWYMSLAIVLIAVVPVFIRAFDKFGYSILILAFLLPRLILPGIEDSELPAFVRYLPTIVLGICANRREWFEKLSRLGGEKAEGIFTYIYYIVCRTCLCQTHMRVYGYYRSIFGVSNLCYLLSLF